MRTSAPPHIAVLAFLVLLVSPPGAWPPRAAWADPPGVRTDRDGARHLPLPPEEGSFTFAIFGDRTGGPAEGIQVLEQAVRDTNLLGPDLVMTVGDLVGGYNLTPAWRAQMEEFRRTMSALAMPWYPVPGNHDVTWGGGPAPPGHHERDYERFFGPLWYWFPHKNAAFVVLYSDEGDRAANRKGWGDPAVTRFSAEQMAWLARVLEATRGKDHVFVFLHHPRWIPGQYPGTNWDEVHALLAAAGNVRAVFAGHIHRQRHDGRRDGIAYFTLGTTGGGIPFDRPGTGYLHHLNLVSVRASGVTIATIPVGAVLDPRAMTPEHLAEVDRLRALAPRSRSEAIALQPDGSAAGLHTLAIANPTTRPIEVTASFQSADRGWFVAPAHHHAAVPPGEERELVFRYARSAEAGLEGLRLPELLLQVDLLAEGLRVTLPERMVDVPWRLAALPTALARPVSNQALRLEGDGACVAVPAARIRVPDGPFTVEAWMRADDLRGRRALLAKSENSEYGLFVSDGRPQFSVWIGNRYVTAGTSERLLETGRWHHVAGAFTGSDVRLYVDGELVVARPGSGRRRANQHALFVGADPDAKGRPTGTLAGLVDEVRVSRGVRYPARAFRPSRRTAPDADTLLLLHLDGSVGPIAPDDSGGENHAVAVGAVSYAPTDD